MTASKLAAGNWKMNGRMVHLEEAMAIAAVNPGPQTEVLICPPATLIAPMAQALTGTHVRVGGQDCHAQPKGAHTGDIAAAMLVDAGASHVILGHSERRADHGETSADVAAKIRAAWDQGLTAILCVGETEAQRDAGETLHIVGSQLAQSLPNGATADNTVIAYEPVWAIGTGRTPTTDQIAEVHAHLRQAAPQGVRLLYGGSVNPTNAVQIFAIPDVNGALVGGASLKAADFTQIIIALAAA